MLIQTPVYRNNVQKGALYCEVMVQRYYTNELFAFQEGKGRTFIVNSEDGAWLLKSPASDMIKLNDDGLYATIKENGNNDSTVKQLKDSIAKQKTGVFEIQGNDATLILCTTPVHEINDWQIVTIMRADMFATQIAQVERNTVFIVVLLIADEFGHELCMDAVASTDAGVVFLVKAAQAEQLLAPLNEQGVLLLSKPFSNTLFVQAMHMAAASNHRLQRLRQENARLQDKISQIRLVSRAKCCLVEHEHLTEAEAHRRIEKLAMDTRRDRTEIAQEILDSYEDVGV